MKGHQHKYWYHHFFRAEIENIDILMQDYIGFTSRSSKTKSSAVPGDWWKMNSYRPECFGFHRGESDNSPNWWIAGTRIGNSRQIYITTASFLITTPQSYAEIMHNLRFLPMLCTNEIQHGEGAMSSTCMYTGSELDRMYILWCHFRSIAFKNPWKSSKLQVKSA